MAQCRETAQMLLVIFCIPPGSTLCRTKVILSRTGQNQTSQPALAQTSGGHGRFGVADRQGSGQHYSQMTQTIPPQQSQPVQPCMPPPAHQQSDAQQRRELPLSAVATADAASPGAWPDMHEDMQDPMQDDFVHNEWAGEDLMQDEPLPDDGVYEDPMEVGGPETEVPLADRDGRCNTEERRSPDAAAVDSDMRGSGGAAVAVEARRQGSAAAAGGIDAARVR